MPSSKMDVTCPQCGFTFGQIVTVERDARSNEGLPSKAKGEPRVVDPLTVARFFNWLHWDWFQQPESDKFGTFETSHLYARYVAFIELENLGEPMGIRMFGRKLGQAGFDHWRTAAARGYKIDKAWRPFNHHRRNYALYEEMARESPGLLYLGPTPPAPPPLDVPEDAQWSSDHESSIAGAE